jgi:YbbR domain-containing protein
MNNLGLKIAAVVIGIFVWLFAKGEQVGDRTFRVPLVLRNMPENVTTVERPDETVEVVLTGDNSELFKLDLWEEPRAVVDMSEAVAGRAFRVVLSPANIVVPRDARVSVSEIREPKTLDFEMDERIEKRLPVVPVVEGNLAEGYYVLGRPNAVPDTVTVFGPAGVVGDLEQVSPAPLLIEGRRSRVEAARPITFPEGRNLNAVPREVRVVVEVEGTAVVTLDGVPVQFEHEPGFESVSIVPEELSLELSGPEHLVTRVSEEDVRAVVDARGLPRGVHQLVPELSLPDGIEVRSVLPRRFTVTLD